MQPNDSTSNGLVDRREYLRLAGTLAAGATVGLAGCAEGISGNDADDSNGGGSSSTGLLSTAVSDDPGDIGDFESCIVTLDGIWVGPKTDEADDEDGDDTEDGDVESDDESDDGDDATNTTEQDDDSGGPPEHAGGSGNSSSEDTVSGSQDDETDGNETDPEGDDVDEDGDDADDADDTEDADDADENDDEGGDDEDGSGGRTYYEFDEPREADLTQLQGDAQQLVGEHELEVTTYQFLQLDIADVSGTLTDGSEASVDTPGNAPLKFNQSFDVREGYRTTFLADFTPVRRGNGSYLFKPVATETEVSYEKIESDGSDSTTDDGNTTDSDGNTTDSGGNTTTADGNTTTSDGNTSTTDENTTDSGGNETSA